MMKRTMPVVIPVLGILALTLAACGRGERTADMHGDMPMGERGMEGMHDMPGMHMDPGMMRRHAEEIDQASARLRPHIQQMRQLSAEQQYERMADHVSEVSQFLRLVDRQMREMDMGMGMSDEQMGRMMGMTGEEHRQMMDGFAELRTELEQVQTAPPAEVRERMPAHLDRLERALAVMEQSARHMGAM
jgi:hypothetical protein